MNIKGEYVKFFEIFLQRKISFNLTVNESHKFQNFLENAKFNWCMTVFTKCPLF